MLWTDDIKLVGTRVVHSPDLLTDFLACLLSRHPRSQTVHNMPWETDKVDLADLIHLDHSGGCSFAQLIVRGRHHYRVLQVNPVASLDLREKEWAGRESLIEGNQQWLPATCDVFQIWKELVDVEG